MFGARLGAFLQQSVETSPNTVCLRRSEAESRHRAIEETRARLGKIRDRYSSPSSKAVPQARNRATLVSFPGVLLWGSLEPLSHDAIIQRYAASHQRNLESQCGETIVPSGNCCPRVSAGLPTRVFSVEPKSLVPKNRGEDRDMSRNPSFHWRKKGV